MLVGILLTVPSPAFPLEGREFFFYLLLLRSLSAYPEPVEGCPPHSSFTLSVRPEPVEGQPKGLPPHSKLLKGGFASKLPRWRSVFLLFSLTCLCNTYAHSHFYPGLPPSLRSVGGPNGGLRIKAPSLALGLFASPLAFEEARCSRKAKSSKKQCFLEL